MKAGSLDRIIRIERETVTTGNGGTVQRTWAPVVTLRAELVLADSYEQIDGQKTSTVSRLVFKSRFFDGIRTWDHLLYAGETFNIREVKEAGRRAALEIKCERAQ